MPPEKISARDIILARPPGSSDAYTIYLEMPPGAPRREVGTFTFQEGIKRLDSKVIYEFAKLGYSTEILIDDLRAANNILPGQDEYKFLADERF